jgi:hypothetical protein
MLMNIIDVIVPIFGIIFLGWLLKKAGILTEKLVKVINDYVYYVGITVITFISLHDTSIDLLLDPDVYLLTLFPILLTIMIAFIAAKQLKLENAIFPVFITSAFFGNTGYIGFPLNIIVLGKESLNMAALISALYTVIVLTVGVYFIKRYSSDKGSSYNILYIPAIWAAIFGVLLSWVIIPDIIRLPISLITDSVSPLALLATGAMVGYAGQKVQLKEIGILSAIKLIFLPLSVIITAIVFGVSRSGMIYNVSLLEAATPVGVTNTVLAAQFKMDHEFVSNAVIISTIISALSLSIFIMMI